jgi:predicted ATPase
MNLQIETLRVVDCGPLRDVRIHFKNSAGPVNPKTLLAGANGSGKTTILEIITSLMEWMLPGNENDSDFESIKRPAAILRRARYVQLDFLIDEEHVTVFFGDQPEDATLAEKWYGWPVRHDSIMLETADSGGHRMFAPIFNFVDQSRFQRRTPTPTVDGWPPAILYYPHSRNLMLVQSSTLERERTLYQPVYRYENSLEYAGSITSYLTWLEHADRPTFDGIMGFLSNLYPDGKTFGIDHDRGQIVVRLRSGAVHDLDLLSSGEQNLLIMLVDLKRRLSPYSIVMIDELENSLHPAFQHRLVQSLLRLQRDVPFQLIVTSHAADVYRVFRAESTLVLPAPRRSDEPRREAVAA